MKKLSNILTPVVFAVSLLLFSSRGGALAQREVIDVHGHIMPFPPYPTPVSEETVRRAVRIMDQNGIVKMVDLNGGSGERLKNRVALCNRLAPGRFITFTNMDFSQVNDPQFSKRAMAVLEEAHRSGARGLKSFKALGLGYKDQNGKLIRFDDPRFDRVWMKCGELGIPVWFHIGDA